MRETWSSRKLFLFAAIGCAVGVGNLWRFPYLAQKYGGGAFLIPYFFALLLLGLPLLILELGLGQYFKLGVYHAFKKIDSRFRGIGIAAILSSLIVVIYYTAILAWSLYYTIISLSSTVPWKGKSQDFFYKDVLNISDGITNTGGIVLPLLFSLFLIWIIIYFIIRKGTHSVQKVVMWTVPLPLILLVILFFRGITLDGAGSGIFEYLVPDLSALADIEVWSAAAAQIFFSLSLSFGCIVTYASLNKEAKITENSLIISLTNSLISIFAGFVIFSILGYMATTQGKELSDVVKGGVGLAFVVFPEALATIPFAPFFSLLFFLTLLSLGIDSAFALVENLTISLKDSQSSFKKKNYILLTCLFCFFLGLPFVSQSGLYFLDLIDHYLTSYLLMGIGILQCLVIGWYFKAEKMRAFINADSKKFKLGAYWDFLIKYFIPLVLGLLIVLQIDKDFSELYGDYPLIYQYFGLSFVLVPLLIVAILFFKKEKKV